MGPRVGRGGLSTGWGSAGDGHILKIIGDIGSNMLGRVEFPRYRRIETRRVLFRAFLKVIKGKASLQTDVGINPRWTAQTSAAQTDGWIGIHELLDGDQITSFNSSDDYFFGIYGENTDNTGAFEMYLALPYIANIVEKSHPGDHHQYLAWVGAIEDQLVDEGLALWNNDVLRSA